MQFRIADTFTDSLGKLTGDEQKAAKTAAFDMQLNPANPGLKMHKLDKAKDKNFWSARVNVDIRIIVHRSQSALLLCYVDHHDKAYGWAERRKLETHPKTGAAQLVEIRETVREIPKYVEVEQEAPPKPPVLAHLTPEELLEHGVPPEWVEDVRAADDDGLLKVAERLPAEAAEAVLSLAVGVTPVVPQPVPAEADPFDHPDAQRRFRLMDDKEELERALEYPWEKWTVFLHPAQRHIVERAFNGPARVAGSAGTGKTIVALHRAVHLAKQNPEARELLATFSDTLANALQTKLRRLISNRPRLGERIDVHSMSAMARRLYELNIGDTKLATKEQVSEWLAEAAAETPDSKFSQRFLVSEWAEVVDDWQLATWEEYRDVKRLGRKTRLPEARREVLWRIFEKVRSRMSKEGVVTEAGMLNALTTKMSADGSGPHDFAVIDEAQDVSVAQLRFLGSLWADKPNGLFFAGDLGQRIFQQPFSWKSLGVDIRGRSSTLRINYRTSHQIRECADRLLGPEVSDVDGNVESRKGTQSVFNGPAPEVLAFDSPDEESAAVGQWLMVRIDDNEFLPHEFGVFVRSEAQLDRARSAVNSAGLDHVVLDDRVETQHGSVAISTMHLAKGMEFRVVVVMACDDEVIPLQERIENVGDDADLADVYETERHLLYVACTRARDRLLVTSGGLGSEFVEDLVHSRRNGE